MRAKPPNVSAAVRTSAKPPERRTTASGEYGGDVALWHLADLDLRDLLPRREVDDRHGIRSSVRDVGALAVRRQGDPVRVVADLRFAEELQIGQRVLIHARVHLAEHDQNLSVR